MGDGGGATTPTPGVRHRPPHKPICGLEPIFGHQNDGNGQKLNTPLGKLASHRRRQSQRWQPYGVAGNPFVNTPNAVPEIWALGFRNRGASRSTARR